MVKKLHLATTASTLPLAALGPGRVGLGLQAVGLGVGGQPRLDARDLRAQVPGALVEPLVVEGELRWVHAR